MGVILCCLLVSAEAADVQLPQPDGSMLRLSTSAQRIITLSPNLAELAYAAGAGPLLVATVEYSDYPEEAMQLPRVGDAFRLDMERIVSLKPDLVISWASGNPQPAIAQLKSLGLPVWSVEILEPGQIAEVLLQIGKASGNEASAQVAADKFKLRLQLLESRYSARSKLSYFYQVADHPLFTINDQHLISRGLKLCGGQNIFADEPRLAFQVSHESVVVANPDVLFAPHLEFQENPLATWLEWPGLKAVKSDALFLLPADEISRATPRWLDATEIACRLMDKLPQRRTHE